MINKKWALLNIFSVLMLAMMSCSLIDIIDVDEFFRKKNLLNRCLKSLMTSLV